MRPGIVSRSRSDLADRSSLVRPIQRAKVALTRVIRPSGLVVSRPQGASSNRLSKSAGAPGAAGSCAELDKAADGGNHFRRCAEIGAVAGGLEDLHFTAGDLIADILAHLQRRDDVVGALENKIGR